MPGLFRCAVTCLIWRQMSLAKIVMMTHTFEKFSESLYSAMM